MPVVSYTMFKYFNVAIAETFYFLSCTKVSCTASTHTTFWFKLDRKRST